MENVLLSEVRTYLETLDYSVLERREDFLVAAKPGLGGIHETQLVWVPDLTDEDEEFPHVERQLLRDFEKESSQYPTATRWLVAHTFGGFSQAFREESERLGIKMRVPIQFFDAPFKSEVLSRATESAIEELRRPRPRIPQPYSIWANGEARAGGDDLLATLRDKYRLSRNSSLRIVVGPAGVGKTWFFRTLFSELYEEFLKHKAILESFPRPIPLCPESRQMHGAVRRTREVIRDFIDTELATYVRQSTFEWMLVHGYAFLMFDGFDELYAEDPEFFDYVEDLLTRPGSNAQILICTRESLLSSCAKFAEFLGDYPPGQSQDPAIEVYRLNLWEYPSKRAFARLRIQDEGKERQFISYIARSDSMRSLSSLPYYCDLLVNEFAQGNTTEFSDDFSLISYTVSKIVAREKAKGILSEVNFEPNGLDEWLEAIANECYTSNGKGVHREAAEEYARLVLNPGLSEEERQSTITTLVQFPLLTRGAETNLLSFQHELVAEYLVARHWLRELVKDPVRVAHEFSQRVDFADSLLARYMAAHLPKQPGGIDGLVEALHKVRPDRDFTVLLQLLLLAVPAHDVIPRYRIDMEWRDLSYVRFVQRDLANCSLRGSNLSGSLFEDCNLQNTCFEGAYLRETRFAKLAEGSLEEARFGNLERFESVYIGQRRIDDRAKFAEWIQKATGVVEPILEPCPTALQLRTLFLKFVSANGTGKRDEMPADTLSRGKRHVGAPSPEECLAACVRSGYLQRVDRHNRVKRVPGDRYGDIVRFVRDWEVSERMRATLDSLCPVKGCEHVPAAYRTVCGKSAG